MQAVIEGWDKGMCCGAHELQQGQPTGVFWRLYVAFWALQKAAAAFEPTQDVVELPAKHALGHYEGRVTQAARDNREPVATALDMMNELLGGMDDLDNLHAEWHYDTGVWGAEGDDGATESTAAASGSERGDAAEPASQDVLVQADDDDDDASVDDFEVGGTAGADCAAGKHRGLQWRAGGEVRASTGRAAGPADEPDLEAAQAHDALVTTAGQCDAGGPRDGAASAQLVQILLTPTRSAGRASARADARTPPLAGAVARAPAAASGAATDAADESAELPLAQPASVVAAASRIAHFDVATDDEELPLAQPPLSASPPCAAQRSGAACDAKRPMAQPVPNVAGLPHGASVTGDSDNEELDLAQPAATARSPACAAAVLRAARVTDDNDDEERTLAQPAPGTPSTARAALVGSEELQLAQPSVGGRASVRAPRVTRSAAVRNVAQWCAEQLPVGLMDDDAEEAASIGGRALVLAD